MYENMWCSKQGNYAPCDWNYAPSPVNQTLPFSASVPTFSTTTPQVSATVCGNGICEAGENGSNCPRDCCDQNTPCLQTRQNDGVHYCRNMYYYDGSASWHGWQWLTATDTTQLCSQAYQAQDGAYYQTQYRCGSSTGKCVSLPDGSYTYR
jgi:hypothetical protein